jgi:hypothetical protein
MEDDDMKLSDLVDFPAACARLASWAAEQILSGSLPPMGSGGSDRPYVYSASVREDEVAVEVRSPRLAGDEQAHCLLIANGQRVTSLWGLTHDGVKYWLMGATLYAVQRAYVCDSTVDCGERDVIPLITEWGRRHQIQVWTLVRATAEAATVTTCSPVPLDGNSSPSAALAGN